MILTKEDLQTIYLLLHKIPISYSLEYGIEYELLYIIKKIEKEIENRIIKGE